MQRHTLLFTDIVDSTAWVARIGDARAAALWAEHDRHARDLLARHDGLEIDRSDGFLLLFDDATAAARLALGYHPAMAEHGLSARVGIHHAGITLRHNPPADVARGAKPVEVEGLAKPLAARIMALARGGQTLLSESAARAVDGTALAPATIHPQGHYRLKGVPEPIAIATLDTVPSAPPADSEKAHRVLRIGELWMPVREVRHNLQAERDAFVGRRAELYALAQQLDGGARLLTLLGPGGTGKTRLVRRYAMAWLGEWPGGVSFCDLSEARSADGIHFAVALALGVPLGKDDSALQLGHAIAGRGRCLVILDNFEQVQAHAAATVGHWHDRASEAAFVVTSRERLQLPGEAVVAVEPMALASDALELFDVRARAQRSAFALNADHSDAVAEIVRMLDGLPLAIELAAARVRVMSPAQIVQRLKDRFALLAGATGAAARQATLKAAIDWSWELLSARERSALAQCSVFEGGFTLEAAESVLALDGSPQAAPVVDVLQALVDKSLLRAWWPKPTGGRLDIAEPYFGMYLSIHEYARQQLLALGAEAVLDAQARHGCCFAALGSDMAMEALMRHGGITRRRALALELDNLVSACRRAVERRHVDVAAATWQAVWAVLEAQGPLSVGIGLGEQVVALEGLTARQRALALMMLSAAQRGAGQTAAADASLEQALAAAKVSDDRHVQAQVLGKLAVAGYRQGLMEKSRAYFEAALPDLQALDARCHLGLTMANLANLQMQQGDMPEARASYAAALALHRQVGNRAAEGIALGNLGTLHHELGEASEARLAYQTALLVHREAGSRIQEAITLANLALLLSEQGELDEAAAQGAAALTIHREIGSRRNEGVVLGQIGVLHQARGEFDAARARYDESLRIHREVGNRPFEGGVLGHLGELLVATGDGAQAMQVLLAGEQLLRSVHQRMELAKLLCVKGRAALLAGDQALARASLQEAEAFADTLGAAPASELGKKIHVLRSALA